MKVILIFGLTAVSLIGCSTLSRESRLSPPEASPETVLLTYQIKAGKERELEHVLSRAWEIYRKERLVFVQPHVIVRTKEESLKPRLVEIFTWVSGDAPDHAPPSVKAIWDEMQRLCEPREGKKGIEGGEVDLLVPQLAK